MTTNNATPLSAEEAQHCEAMPHKDKSFCDSVADKLDAIASGQHVVVPAAEIAALKAEVKELVEALAILAKHRDKT